MLKMVALTAAWGAVAGFACTITPTPVRYDTVSPDVVAVTTAVTGEPSHRDTILVSRRDAFVSHVQNMIEANTHVFIGRIDSIIQGAPGHDTVPPGLVPDLELSSYADTVSFASRYYLRFRVDTLMKGTLPGKTFWVRTRAALTTCDLSYQAMKGRVFLNASTGFTDLSDLKLDVSWEAIAYTPSFPSAHWFDGRYLLSPDFPGLRLDITEVYPDYPATSVRHRAGAVPAWRPEGKAYLPDGRAAPSGPDRKIPVPVLK